MPSRYICDVLTEMRKCIKTLNFSYMESLIEEAQVLANRMEAGLGTKRDIEWREETLRDLKKEIKELKKEKKGLINESS